MKVLKVIIYTGIVLFGTILGLIGWYGGYNEVSIEERQNSTYTIYGSWYKGSANDKAWGDFFDAQEKAIKAVNPEAAVVAYYPIEPVKKKNFYTEAFVGTTEEGILSQDTLMLSFEKSVYASKEAHQMVTRLPLNLYQYAQKNGDTLDMSRMIEFYITERKMGLEIPYAALSSN